MSSRQPMRPDGLRWPHPSRLADDAPHREACLAAHAEAVAAGRPGYLDPATGLFVMTATDLAARGWCCDRGCRHCPYVGAEPGETPTDQTPTDETPTDETQAEDRAHD